MRGGPFAHTGRAKGEGHVVGVIGLVENMPDGDAMRPGDILTSMSGQTIEVINTDAKGRLVLADALWYAQDTFSPKAIIDLGNSDGRNHCRAGPRTTQASSPITTSLRSA